MNREATIFKKYLPNITKIVSEAEIANFFDPLRCISIFSFCGEPQNKSTFLRDCSFAYTGLGQKERKARQCLH